MSAEAELDNLLTTIKNYHFEAEQDADRILNSLTIKNFKSHKKPKEVIAIDGSHCSILSISNLWLVIIKVCALHYKISNGFHLEDSSTIEVPVLISTDKETGNQYSRGYQLSLKDSSELINEYRRAVELNMADKIVTGVKNKIISLDGTLTTSPKLSKQLNEIIKKSNSNDNILVGVSKDSQTRYFKSKFTDEHLLARYKSNECNYVKAPHTPETQRSADPLTHGEIYFVRYYPTVKWFRTDLARSLHDKPEDIFAQLASYANSTLCPGYIYPLLEAHRCAVGVRKFRELYERKILELAKDKFKLEELLSAFTDSDGNRQDSFHALLDRICK